MNLDNMKYPGEIDLDELTLVRQAQSGNKLSLNMLLEDNYKILYGFLLKSCGDVETAKDLTQDTMIKAVIKIGQFKGDARFSSWLIRIGINTYKNHIRKNRAVTVALNETIQSGEDLEVRAELRDQLRRINEFLQGVKPKDRMIFVLKHYEGYNYDEIARMTGVRKGTCKSKMHYLMKKLKMEVNPDE